MAAIADTSFPYTAGSIDEAKWMILGRHWLKAGVIPNAAGDSLLCFGDSTGMQVKVKAGEAYESGAYGKWNAQFTLTGFSSAGVGAGQHRVDRIVVRSNLAADQMEIDVLTGAVTALSVWTLPPLTNDATKIEREIGLVNITQGLATIPAGNVIDVRSFVRPAFGGYFPGQYIWSADPNSPAFSLTPDGRAVNRFTEKELFAAIGTTYGAGDGVTTFNVPDRRGEGLMVPDNHGGVAAGRTTGLTSLTAHYGASNIWLTEVNLPQQTVRRLDDLNQVIIPPGVVVNYSSGGLAQSFIHPSVPSAADVRRLVTMGNGTPIGDPFSALQPSGVAYLWLVSRPTALFAA